MGNLVIIDGYLYKDGQKQKLEFGNIEQINAIREYERSMAELQNDGLELEPEYEIEVNASVSFKCGCGCNVYFEVSASTDGDIDCFDGMSTKCKCNNRYKLSVDREENLVLCKLIK